MTARPFARSQREPVEPDPSVITTHWNTYPAGRSCGSDRSGRHVTARPRTAPPVSLATLLGIVSLDHAVSEI